MKKKCLQQLGIYTIYCDVCQEKKTESESEIRWWDETERVPLGQKPADATERIPFYYNPENF